MNDNTKSKLAYTILACICLIIIIVFGILLYHLKTQVEITVNSGRTESTRISTIIVYEEVKK